MDTPKHFLRSAKTISACTLVSRILGLVRDKLAAYYFGRGLVWDAFALAFMIPNLFRRLFGEGALSATFIPVFTDYLERRSREDAQRLFSATLTLLLIVLSAITLLLEAAIWAGLRIFTWEATLDLTLRLLQVLTPFLVFVCISAFLSAVLYTHKQFALPAIAPALLNVFWIAGIVIIAPAFGDRLDEKIFGVALGVLIGEVAIMCVQIPPLMRHGFRPRLGLAFREPGLRTIVRNMMPMVVGIAIFQINLVADNLMALFLVAGDGAISSLYFANRLLHFPLALVGFSLSTAIFPTLSRMISSGNHHRVAGALTSALRSVIFLGLPAGAGLAVLGVPIIQLLFQDGLFGAEDTMRTFWVVASYCGGLWAFCGVQLLVRTFHSVKDTATPVRIGVWMVGLNVLLNLAFVFPMREAGLALATSITSTIQFFLLYRIVRRHTGALDTGTILRTALKALLLTVVMAGLCYGVYLIMAWQLPTMSVAHRCLRVFVPMVAAAAVYAAGAHIVKMKELREIVRGHAD